MMFMKQIHGDCSLKEREVLVVSTTKVTETQKQTGERNWWARRAMMEIYSGLLLSFSWCTYREKTRRRKCLKETKGSISSSRLHPSRLLSLPLLKISSWFSHEHSLFEYTRQEGNERKNWESQAVLYNRIRGSFESVKILEVQEARRGGRILSLSPFSLSPSLLLQENPAQFVTKMRAHFYYKCKFIPKWPLQINDEITFFLVMNCWVNRLWCIFPIFAV